MVFAAVSRTVRGGLPEEFERAVASVRQDLPRILGAELMGIYLYGSVLEQTFVAGRSDLDGLAVTRSPLDEQVLDRLRVWVDESLAEDPSFARVQMSFLVEGRVLDDDPDACLLQFGSLRRTGSDGNPIVWLDHFSRGETLYGRSADEVVPEITQDLLHDALHRELGYLREELFDKPDSEWRDVESYRAYAVLTSCRILYSHATRRVTSKPAAAAWVVEHTPGEVELHELIAVALGAREPDLTSGLDLPSIRRLIDHVQGALAS